VDALETLDAPAIAGLCTGSHNARGRGKKTLRKDLEAAKSLLAHEGSPADDTSGEIAAAERVYARLFDCLAPIIGPAGVLALFLRSAKLAQADHPELGALREVTTSAAPDSGIELFRSLSALDPSLVAAASASVYARFLGLLTTLIGERLAAQILDRSFPELAATPEESE
jgi:hypothetical protein